MNGSGWPADNGTAPDMNEEVTNDMSLAAVFIARIRGRERVMANIARRNPDTYRTNQYYSSLNTSAVAYRDALAQLERESMNRAELVLSR